MKELLQASPKRAASKLMMLALTVAAVVSPTLATAGAAQAESVTRIDSCPYVIAAPGQYLVAEDLACPVGTAITIVAAASGANLNLGGRTINGEGNTTGEGIDVLGAQSVLINNGTVTGFLLDDGIRLQSDGSRLSGLTLTGNQDGLGMPAATNNVVSSSSFSGNQRFGVELSDSSSNSFTGNTATENGSDGFAFFSSSDNDIKSSLASGNENGVAIRGGSGNTIRSSQTFNNDHEGIAIVAADNNVVKANSSQGNGFHGILVVVGAVNNTITSNTSLNNGIFDMGDENPNCDTNVWQHNNFNTANQPQCIE